MLQAINPKNQAKVNKAVAYLTKHNALNNQRDAIEGEFGEDSKQWRAIDKKCHSAFSNYLEICWDDLPKYEVKAIEKSNIY